jgi:hypothetical protein
MIALYITCELTVCFDPDQHPEWDIIDKKTGLKIGSLGVDDEGMVLHVEINADYQRRGIATAVFRYLVEECGYEFSFWPPDGLTYDDGRHLSEEGASLANSLVRKNLARWVRVGACEEAEDF